MGYVVDTDWLIDAAIGRAVAVRTIDRLTSDGVAFSIISVAELYEVAFGTYDPETTLVHFRRFLGSYTTLPLTDSIAERFARLRATLRQRGQLIPDMDLLIAATAIDENLVLVTRNLRHFDRIGELNLYRA